MKKLRFTRHLFYTSTTIYSLCVCILSLLLSGCSFSEQSKSGGDKSDEDISLVEEIDLNTVIEKSEYELLRDSSILVGRWKEEWTAGITLNVEFFRKGDEYFEVRTEGTPVINKLIKRGEKYYVTTKGMLYYVIAENGDLKAYDEEGYIGEEFGFKYVKY